MHDQYTHICREFNDNHEDLLFRADDGILIAQRIQLVVVFGEEPNKRQSRQFIDEKSARAYLHKVAADDLKEHGIPAIPPVEGAIPVPIGPTIKCESGFGKVVLPAGAQVPGGIKNFR